jgi:NAD dependent epimerase/dehydratase family enzyme
MARWNRPRARSITIRQATDAAPEDWPATLGLGGPVAGGAQYVSWIHDEDFVRAVEFLIGRDDFEGPVNLASPGPLPHRAFMRALRTAWGVPVGLPATRWMAGLGAFALRSDTELLLKSRRVVPGRLQAAGFTFAHPEWQEAATSLVQRARADRAASSRDRAPGSRAA